MKRTAFLMMGAALATWGFVVACSDDKGSTFNETKPNTATDGGSTFGNGGVGEAGVVTCSPTLSASFTVTHTEPTSALGACTADQLGTYYDDCLGVAASVTSCSSWKTANAACEACVEADGGTGPIVVTAGKYQSLNLGGCIALKVGVPGDAGACSVAEESMNDCQIASCLQCIQKDGVQGDAINNCVTAATDTGCARFKQGITDSCVTPGIIGPDGGAYACVASAGEAASSKTRLVRLMSAFCGAAH